MAQDKIDKQQDKQKQPETAQGPAPELVVPREDKETQDAKGLRARLENEMIGVGKALAHLQRAGSNGAAVDVLVQAAAQGLVARLNPGSAADLGVRELGALAVALDELGFADAVLHLNKAVEALR